MELKSSIGASYPLPLWSPESVSFRTLQLMPLQEVDYTEWGSLWISPIPYNLNFQIVGNFLIFNYL